MTVHILIDSSAGLPVEIAEELDITVLDLHILEDEGERVIDRCPLVGLSL